MVLLLGALALARAQAGAGNALRFTSTNSYVSVPHDVALNAYPFTVTAWFRTTNSAIQWQGIVGKYVNGSGDGWQILVQNGVLRGFYFRTLTSVAINTNSATPVADGFWHQAALVVDATGGKLYLDGAVVGQSPWSGGSGAPTSTQPLEIGRFNTSTYPFDGDIDEVAVWNRSLDAREINYLKHRQLNGNEDGLVALWHFDESSGLAATDATGHGHTGTLQNTPARIASSAPLVFNAVAGTALNFDGADDFVDVPNAAALNAYPLTVMAWVRTARNSSPKDGLVSKYGESSGNGYSLFVAGGHLHAWYFRDGGNYVYDGVNGVDGGAIADGFWHHIALVVDAAGGRFYVDGTQTGSLGWTGTPGAPTTSTNLQLGKYWMYSNSLLGAMDEVSVWNVALTPTQIATYENAPLVGSESGLVALWHLNEGSGTTASDGSGHGHGGTLQNGIAWTGSTAFLGDGTSVVLVETGLARFTRAHAVDTIPAQNAFVALARFEAWRLDDFGASGANTSLTVTQQFTLTGSSSGAVPLANSRTNFTYALAPFNAAAPPVAPAGVVKQSIFALQPTAQLDSVNNTFTLDVATTHSANGAPFVADESSQISGQRLLHFNGTIYFGPVATVFTDLSTFPTAASVSPPSFLSTSLKIPFGAAHLVSNPAVTFGDNDFSFTSVDLGADGTATNTAGGKSLSIRPGALVANGIHYSLSNATLTAAGAAALGVTVQLPTGFGVQYRPNVRVLDSMLTSANPVTLDAQLAPVSDLVFTAASYGTNELYFAEDTKPFFIVAPQVEWHVAQGEFYLAQADALQFVRQQEDDELAAQRPNLVVPLAADRISNDEYYHDIAATAGAPVYIRPDTNGTARLTMQATLQENEYRPHFPYLNRNVGDHVPMVGGALSISNDLVDTAASYLLINGPAPIPYARDCSPDSGCTSFATNGPLVLPFTAPVGHLGLGEFSFTPEGGLLAYGTVPPTNLTWGFIQGNDYAQRTSDVSTGVCFFAGTFLRPDDLTSEQDYQLPARLLLSGYGLTNGVTYVERPGQSNYLDGFANYPGLNFRAPAQGRSLLAAMDTGWYPLTARSKYYVRYGGVNGIHESVSFPASLTAYGYPFSFASYRLSYLDGDNHESRTDGQVVLPYPSDFTVEFERMKFLCRGNLDTAELPATVGQKKMSYWNTYIQPLALDFKPLSADPCSFANRYLVLGVGLKLPFISNAFHARLGFKPDGNLATPATGIADGVDSRFPVAANLQLQGPGGSYFPLTTAAEGYFNNYQSAPSVPGFFNLVGRLRVPFFRDVKVQLHVTPLSQTDATIAIMGGWPAEEGLGANRGWNVGAQNYFNTAKFDPNSDGWPTAVSLNQYRHSPDENYRPRAQRNWIEVAGFDYPLDWNPLLREFRGFTPATVTLPVIDVDSDLKELSPGKVDFDFAQDLDLKLPRIKLLDLANDAVNEINAPLNTLSNAIASAVQGGLDASGITKGFRSLQTLLREDAGDFFRPVLETALTAPGSNVVDNLYTALAPLAGNKTALLANTAAIVSAGSNGLQTAIQSLNGTTADATKVVGQIAQTLHDVDDTMGLFQRVLQKDPDGKRHVVQIIIQKLVQDQGPAIGFFTTLGDSVVNDLLADLDPTLTQLESELTDLRAQFQQVRAQIGAVPLATDFNQSLELANHDLVATSAFLQQAGGAVSNLLGSVVGPAGDFFTADPARAREQIREQLILAFLGSPIPGKYQQTFRQFLYDKNFLLDQIMNVLFDQLNRTIRNGLEQQVGIAGETDGVFDAMKGVGRLSGSLASAKIRGAPTFQGDSLRAIHLDSQIKLNLPDEMNFSAFMDIKELDSATAPLACIPAGGAAAEVTLGANDIPLDWAGVPSVDPSGKKLTLSVAARWTLAGGAVKGIGGSLGIRGQAGFKGCSMSEIQAALAIGEVENYFTAQAKATVVILGAPVDFRAGMFAGHACSLDALKLIDPEVEQVLQQPGEFDGVYLEFGGGLSLSDILFGESSDALDVRADISTALFYQGGPRFGRIGGRQSVNVDVKLLYVLEGSAGWTVFVVLDTANQLTVGGSAQVCGRIGVCPFCVEGCKEVKVTGVIKDNGIDYFIDY